jgi:DNA-directed RNA polymerase specialized sigma24 family protein
MRMELVGQHAHSLREERVLTIVGHTTPRVRETLVLRDLQVSISRRWPLTAVPIDTVMSRLARARQRVMTTIAKDENDATR